MPSIGQFSALKIPESNLPAVTYGMTIDFLGKERILFGPSSLKRVFRWLKVHGADGFEPSEGIRTGQLLHICRIEHARKVLDENAEAFICAASYENDAPSWAPLYEGRLMVVKIDDAFLYFCFLVMKLFTDSLLLRTQLDRIVRDGRSLQELAEAAAPALDAELACLDASGYELARACCPKGEAGEEAHVMQRDVLTEGLVFATLVLITEGKPSQGQMDLFELSCEYAENLCRNLWEEQSRIACPHRQVFVDLIEGRKINQLGDEDVNKLTKLEGAVQFKLVLLNREAGQQNSFSNIASRAKLINRKKNFVFAYRGDICVLCYEGDGDKLLSHKKTLADVRKHLSKQFGINAVSSQIFESLHDLDLAYEQAVIAREVRPLVVSESTSSEASGTHDVIPFEACLIYYLIRENDKNDRLLAFTFSHTLMQKLSMEDALNGTDYLNLFWHYLLCERNATAVAERMHVHRNTVLYRMKKIQDRFDLDLDDPDVREKMIIDFKMFFLLQSHQKE